jgi:O2-independent ubiquinone biosynthesis accessory factor UbiT
VSPLRPPPLLPDVWARLPQFPHSVLLAAAANLFLRGVFAPEEEAFVEGCVVRLAVRDAGIRASLRLAGRGILPCGDGVPADVTVTADARAFALLALGRADPDALFFERRLVIEGNTELALTVRNALDRRGPPLPPSLADWLASRLS